MIIYLSPLADSKLTQWPHHNHSINYRFSISDDGQASFHVTLLWKRAQKTNWAQITVIYGDLNGEDDRRYARIRLPNQRFRYTHVLSRMIFVTASFLNQFQFEFGSISEIQSSQNHQVYELIKIRSKMTEHPLIPGESLILCHSSCHGVRLVIDAFHLSKYFNFRKRKIVVFGRF